MNAQNFLYFAYGSNLLKQRLQLMNPSAVYQTTAKLPDYKLTFRCIIKPTESRWKGATASIEPSKDGLVWGTVWQLSMKDIPSLDRQENIYKAVNVDVISKDNTKMNCRTYLLEPQDVPTEWDSRPSPQYLDVIIRGACQSDLPQEYIKQLRDIEHNSYSGSVKVYEDVLKLLSSL